MKPDEKQPDGGTELKEPTNTEIQTYVPERTLPGKQSFTKSADFLEEFNRALWELAKSVFIIVAMLLGVSFVIIAGMVVMFFWGFV